MYSLGTWFVSGICVDTLHKGENYDDDDDNNNNNNNVQNSLVKEVCLQVDTKTVLALQKIH
jgi:hypothetical protein